jgi:hypothetical protein
MILDVFSIMSVFLKCFVKDHTSIKTENTHFFKSGVRLSQN